MMATDKEIRMEAVELYDYELRWKPKKYTELLELAIKKGIQMERERIRKNIMNEQLDVVGGKVCLIKKIDIWDDVK